MGTRYVQSGDESSLEKGLAILSQLAGCESGMSVGELASAANLTRATAYRLCELLEKRGWIKMLDASAGRRRRIVHLGPRLLGMAVLIESMHSLQSRMHPIIAELAETLGETVHVGDLDRAQIVHIGRAFPSAGLNVSAEIGSREWAYLTGLGKALLATLPDRKVRELYPDEVLAGRTDASITSVSGLISELDAIRERGYATDREEARVGVACVAAPVFDAAGRGLVAISMTAASSALPVERVPVVAEAVRAAARDLTEAIGGKIPSSWPQPDLVVGEPLAVGSASS